MRKRLRKSLAGILALLMVVTNFQLTGLQVSAEEVTTEDKTYTMDKIDKAMDPWGVEAETIADGGQKLSFAGNYSSYFWKVPEELKDAEITKITFDVKNASGIEGITPGWFGYKIFTEELFTSAADGNGIGEGYSMYGNPTREVPVDLEAPIKYVAITSANDGITGPVEMEISSITFTVKKEVSSESGSGNDQTGSGSGDSLPDDDQTGSGSDSNQPGDDQTGGESGENNDNVQIEDGDNTFTMAQVDKAMEPWGVEAEDIADGGQKLSFGGNYSSYFWAVPEELADVDITNITFNVKSVSGIEGITTGWFGYKIFTEELFASAADGNGIGEGYSMYGNPAREVPADLEAPIKYLAITSANDGITGPVEMEISGITFTVKKDTTSDSGSGNDQTGSGSDSNQPGDDQTGGESGENNDNVQIGDNTFTMAQVDKAMEPWGVEAEDIADGGQKLSFGGNYSSYFWAVPEELADVDITNITFNVKSVSGIEGITPGWFGYKIFTEELFASAADGNGIGEGYSMYGNPAREVPADLEAPIKYLAITSANDGITGPVEMEISGITFTVKEKATSDGGSGNDQTGGSNDNAQIEDGDNTFTMAQVDKAMNPWGVEAEGLSDGGQKLSFGGNYSSYFWAVPEELADVDITNITFNVKSVSGIEGITPGWFGYKIFTEELFASAADGNGIGEGYSMYGNPAREVPADLEAPIKYLAITSANDGITGPVEMEISSITFTVKKKATSDSDLTFTADEVSIQWGSADCEQVEGKIDINFVKQYNEIKIQLPQAINMADCESVKYVVADQNIPIALKLWVGAEEKERWVQYGMNGSTEYVVTPNITDTIDVVGIMCSEESIPEGSKVSFISVTFKMKPGSSSGSGSSTPENLGENIIINGNFADADVSMWDSNQGSSVISATSGDKAIFDDVKTYGVIDRTASDIKEEKSTGHGFVQDVTDRVEKGGEYYIEYYAMLSEDYADAPDAQKMVEFLPYFVLDGKEQYLGAAYSAELSGFKSEPAKVGEWTKFSGYFTISCRGEEDKVVLRFMEQGTNYGSGDCVQGDYYITGVSMRRTDKPIPEIPEIEKDIPDWRDTIVGDLGAGTIAGTAVTASEMRDETLMELVTKHFNAVTFGNELKLDAMIGSKKFETVKFNGEDLYVPILNHSTTSTMLDKILAWNTANPDKQIKVRGHVFVWHSQAPSWFFKENYDDNAAYVSKEVMDKRLEWYIKTMLEYYTGPNSKYKDLFYGWDVVNEAINDSTNTYRGASESSWAAVYGDQSNEYIIKAFQYANKYAPASLELYYNDYNDCVPGKVQGIVNLMKAVLAAEGTRIDAMGMQAHHDMKGPSVEQVEAAVRAYCEVVGKVQWTELDIKASSSYDGTDATRDDEYSKMAHLYKDYYEVLKKLDAEDGIEVSGITFWGVVDKYSWLQTSNSVGGASSGGKQCPLLFDDNYKAKPAFWAFVDSNKLTPEVQNIVAISYVDDTYSQGNVYNIAQGNTKATFVPMWDNKGLKVLVDVQDATVDAADAVTVYVDAAMTAGETTPVAVTVKRADAEATSGGYKAVVEVPVSGTAVAKQVLMDVVVVNGAEKAAFNDTTFAQATNSKYYAVVMMKPTAKIEKGTVVVDGTVDELWSDVDAISLNINKGSTVEATAKLLWDENYLYVLYEVKDSVLNKAHKDAWEQDSVEVFIDENNGKTASLDADDKQYRVGYENDQSFNGQKCTADNMKSVAKTTADGYMVEAAFKWTDITPEDGTKIGLELQINDAAADKGDGKPGRIGTLSWFDETGMGYAGSNVFGTVTLNERGLKEMVDDLSVLVDENATKEEKKQAVIEIIAEVKELVANKDTEELTAKYVEEIEELFEESIGRALDVVNKYNSVPQIDKVIGALIGIDADKDAKMVFESTTANALGAEYRNAIAFDIKLFADDEAVQPLVPVTIRMAIPPCINKNGKVVVLHYADSSFVPEKLDSKIVGDWIEFTTTSFSTFVIANEVALENNNGGSNTPAATPTPAPSTDSGVKAPATGDSAYPAAVVAVLLLSGSAAVIMARRKKEEEEKK